MQDLRNKGYMIIKNNTLKTITLKIFINFIL